MVVEVKTSVWPLFVCLEGLVNEGTLVFVAVSALILFGTIGGIVWEAVHNNRKDKEFKKYKEELHNVLERKNP